MSRKMFASVVSAAMMMIASNVFAENQGAFHPAQSSDWAFIANNGYGIYNVDTTSARSVTVSLGQYPSGTRTFTFYGNAEGNTGTMTCTVFGVTEPVLGSTQAHASISATDQFSLQVPITLPGGNAWYLSATCSLPPKTLNPLILFAWN